MKRTLLHLIVPFLISMPSVHASTLTLPLMNQAPAVDGKIADGEWEHASGTANFLDVWLGFADLRKGFTRVGFTQDRLYILCVSEVPPTGALSKFSSHDTDQVVFDDSIELWLDPNRVTRESGAGDLQFYQAIFSPAGGIYDVRFDPKGMPDRGWNAKWECSSQVDPKTGMMVMEISVPFADLGWKNGESPVGKTIGVLVARNFKQPWNQGVWFPTNGHNFAKPLGYAAVRLTDAEPAVSVVSTGPNFQEGHVDFNARLFNPGKSRDVRISLKATSSDMPGFTDEKVLHLPEGKPVEYTFQDKSLHADAEHTMQFTVSSPEGAEPIFDYTTKWSNGTKVMGKKYPDKWLVQTKPSPEDALAVAFYPTLNLARVRLDPAKLFQTPEEATSVESAKIVITGPGGKQIAERTLNLAGAPVEETFRFDAMPDGEYVSTAQFRGIKEPVSKKWTRRSFPWEGNTLGITKKIYKPFEPVRVEGSDVKVVQREYKVDGLGLWTSINSVGKELLASPIAFKVGDRPIIGRGKFTASDPQRAVFEGSAEAPGARISTRCTTEIDGVMKVELTLAPGVPGEALDSLILDIPIVEQRAQLFHVATTGLRSNPAGALPNGTGEVWNSSEFPDGSWIGNFKPYVWIGDGQRGISFFADNDAGWELNLLDKNRQTYTPAQTILRENGAVTLRIHLIQKPTVLRQARTIVFGLMATPGKPMPANWRRTVLNNEIPGCESVMFMGSQYWGSDQDCSGKYPRNGDLTVLDAIRDARLQKPLDAGAFVKDWTSRHFQPDMPVVKTQERMTHLLELTFNRARAAGRKRFTVYFDEFHSTNKLHAEVPVFGSEWSGKFGYGSVGGLARSHQDFSCFYGAEFVKRGIGLYFDNAFPKLGMDPLTTNAYRLPDGRIQPSAGIWAHRDYLRRIWNIHREYSPSDLPTFMIIHMTNTEIAPYTVWNDGNLDLEWMYGPEPKQSIYSPELLRAESTGLISGNTPFVLARVHKTKSAEEQAFSERCRFGAMMVHEIKSDSMAPTEVAMFAKLLEFGYGLEDCEVFQYWTDDFPLRVSDDRVKTLLLKRGGELFILVCSWDPEPTTVKIDLSGAGLGGKRGKAVNCESGDPSMKFDGARELSMQLEGYGVKLVRISPEA